MTMIKDMPVLGSVPAGGHVLVTSGATPASFAKVPAAVLGGAGGFVPSGTTSQLMDGSGLNVTVGTGLTLNSTTHTLTAAGGGYTPPQVIQDAARVIDPKDAAYGAKLDGRIIFDAVTSAGTTLTSATAAFTSADAGKVIAIVGAGAAGAHHVTTIASFTNATTVVLAAAASQASTTGWCVFGTDDTAGWQAAITAADTAGGGRIVAPAGISIINGPLITTGGCNSQLVIPLHTSSQNEVTIEMAGAYGPPTPEAWNMPASKSGTILFCTRISATGTRPVMLGCTQTPGGTFNFNMVRLNLANFTFRCLPNAPLGLVDGTLIAAMNVKDCHFYSFANTDQLTTAPTNTANVALRASGRGSMCAWRCENLFIHGFYTGFINGEAGYNDNIFCYACVQAFVNPVVDYPSDYSLAIWSWCPNGMVWTGAHHCNITSAKTETGPAATGHGAAWMNTVYHFDDGSTTDTYNWMGRCNGYYQITAGVGVTAPGNSLLVRGCGAAVIQPQPNALAPITIPANIPLEGHNGAWVDVASVSVAAAGDMVIDAAFSLSITQGGTAGIIQVDFQLYDPLSLGAITALPAEVSPNTDSGGDDPEAEQQPAPEAQAGAVAPNGYRMYVYRTFAANEAVITYAFMSWPVRSAGPNNHAYKIQARESGGWPNYTASGTIGVQIKSTTDLNGGSMVFRRSP